MKLTICCEGTPEEINKQLLEAANVFAPDEISIEEIKTKRGRKPKEAPVAEVADDEDENDDFSDDIEDEALSETDLAMLRDALKNYSQKVNKKKAVEILKGFAERSDLVKPADLPKLMKLLKV